MVSRFPYSSFKGLDWTRPVSFIWVVVVAVVFVIIGGLREIVLLAVFGGYALWSPLQWLWRRLRRFKRHERAAPGGAAE